MDSGVVTGNACHGVGLKLLASGEDPSKSTAFSSPADPMSISECGYHTITIEIQSKNPKEVIISSGETLIPEKGGLIHDVNS